MTGNQIKGKGFKGALDYNLKKVENNQAEMLDHNFIEVTRENILKEVMMTRNQRPDLKKFFYHTSINFPPNENISNDLMKKIGKEYLEGNGFMMHQYIMFRHRDANHPHLHILVNRIGFDGKVLSDSNDYARSENVLRELEKKYNLTQVLPSKQARQRAMTKDEMEMMKRTDMPSEKLQLQVILKDILKSGQKMTTEEFIKSLKGKGVNVKFNQATTGYVSGISYSYEGFTVTGGKLGQDFKWAAIRDKIDYNQDRDKSLIQQVNQEERKPIAQSIMRQQPVRLKNYLKEHREDINTNSQLEKMMDILMRPEQQQHEVPSITVYRKKRRRKGRSL